MLAFVVAAGGPLWSACAQQGAPQGGPPDATPPLVESTAPASADVLVDRRSGLTVQFSEPINKSTFAGNLQISPARAGDTKIEWANGGRRVTMSWSDTLRDSTSYRVTISNRVADRRGNPLAEPYTFAFSTGPQVDRGEIRGRIVVADKGKAAFDVFAYRLESMPDTFWLSPPDYSTQSAADGRFQLPFLRAGRYRLLALTDNNRDQRLDHGEAYAIAPRDFAVADETPPDSATLFTVVRDTVPFRVRHCAAVGPRLIAVGFTHAPDTTGTARWRITVVDSATGALVEARVIPPTARRPSQVLLSGDWTPAGVCSITVGGVIDQRGQALADSVCRCLVDAGTDSTGPRIESVALPDAGAALSPLDPIRWVFTEPLDTARLLDGVQVQDTLGNRVDGAMVWRNWQELSFVPTAPWPDTLLAVVTLDSAQLVDWAGNPAGPGVYRWQFRPLAESQMGEVEGRVSAGSDTTVRFWLEARSVDDSRLMRAHVSLPGSFRIALPAGRWQLGGFVDADDDGRWSAGALDSFMHAERRMLAPDTIIVRARFTLEDINLEF